MQCKSVIQSELRFFSVALVVLFVFPLCAALAAPSESSVSAYDIPTSELNKVRKKYPSKRTVIDSKKKKISDHKSSEVKPENDTPAKKVDEVKNHAGEPENLTRQEQTSSSQLNQLVKQEDVLIHHTPYSFVVPGKRTTVNVVINSKTEIQEVTFTLHSANGAAQTQGKMEKVSGTQFTYSASLPGLPAVSASLRYSFGVVDSVGKVSNSQVFMTPVSSSSVVPSWQFEKNGEAAVLEQKKE